MSNILPTTTRWYNCFFEPFFTDYLLENDFVKNKSAVRCSFLYFSGLFSKAFFILLHRRCDKLCLFQGTRRNVRWTFQGQAQRSKRLRRLCRPQRSCVTTSYALFAFRSL